MAHGHATPNVLASFEELHHEGTLLVLQRLSWSKATLEFGCKSLQCTGAQELCFRFPVNKPLWRHTFMCA